MLGPFYSSEVLPPLLAEQASQTCWVSHSDLLDKPPRLAGQASLACRTSFLKCVGQVWAFVLTGGPCERMGPTFVGHADVGILDLRMGPLGLPGLISQFHPLHLLMPQINYPTSHGEFTVKSTYVLVVLKDL